MRNRTFLANVVGLMMFACMQTWTLEQRAIVANATIVVFHLFVTDRMLKPVETIIGVSLALLHGYVSIKAYYDR